MTLGTSWHYSVLRFCLNFSWSTEFGFPFRYIPSGKISTELFWVWLKPQRHDVMWIALWQAMLAAKRKIDHLQEQLQQEEGATQNALDLFSGSLMVCYWKSFYSLSTIHNWLIQIASWTNFDYQMSLISFFWGWVLMQALSVADEKLKELERQIASVTVASQQEREFIAEITSLKVRMLGVLIFCG